MKKKKVFLGGLLGISIIAAGITLASCKSIPLTPYESSKTAVPTPTPTSGETPQESTTTPAQDPTTGTTPATTPSEGTGTQTSSTDVAPTAFTITYNANGHGENLPEAVIGATALPATLPTMEADGYTFVGWATTATATESDVTAGQAITADVTLYAIWEEEADNYVVVANFDATELTTGDTYVEGQTEDTTEEKADVTSAELCDGFFTKVGTIKKRSKQYKDASDTKQYSSECVSIEANKDSGLTFTVTRNSKVVLSLQSTSSSNKSVFTLNDSSDNAVAASNASSLTQNETANHYVITGSAVEVKYELEAGTYKMLFVDEKAAASDSSSVNRGGRFFSILVKSEPVVSYGITYVANGHGENLPEAVLGATKLPDTLPTMTADGYQFVGWATEATATESDVTAGQALTADITLYAIWRQLAQPVTVSYNTGVDGIEFASSQIEKNATLTALPTLPTSVTDYVIEGFFTDNTYQTPFTTETVVTDDIEVFVKLKRVYTITYHANGIVDDPEAVSKVDKLPDTLPELTKDGYEFLGWSATENGTTAVTAGTALTSNADLYAIWNKVFATVFDLNEYVPTTGSYKVTKAGIADINFYQQGIYGSHDDEKLNGTISSDGKLLVKDTDNSSGDAGTQYVYIAQGGAFTTGVVEWNLKVNFPGLGGKWSLIHVIGSNTNSTPITNRSIFAIGTEGSSNRYFSYALNGTNVTLDNNDSTNYVNPDTLLNKIKCTASTDYVVKIRIDLDNKKISYSINGQDIVSVDVPTITSVSGLYFQTAASATDRSITVSDFTCNYKGTLEQFKAEISPYVQAIAQAYDIDHNYTAHATEMNQLVTKAATDLAAATTHDDVYGIMRQLLSDLEEFESDAVIAVRTAKENAIAELNSYKAATDYTINNTAFNNALSAGLESINSANSTDTIATALTNAKAALDAIENDSVAKTGYIEGLLSNYSASLITDGKAYTENEVTGYINKTDYDSALSTFNTTCSSITAKNDIDAAFATLEETVATIKTDAALRSEANAAYLLELEGFANTDIEQLDQTQWADIITSIANMKETGATNITNAISVKNKKDALTNAESSITLAIESTQKTFDEVKSDAETELLNYKNQVSANYDSVNDADLLSNITTAYNTALAAIENITVESTASNDEIATAKAQVNTELTNGKSAIDALVAADTLAKEKANAVTTLYNYISEKGSAATLVGTYASDQMLAVYNTGTTAINDSTSVDAVTTALNTAKSNVDSTITAIKAHEFTITYSGTSLADGAVVYGNAITKPATDPTQENKVFIGWYTTDQYTNEYDFANTLIYGDTTIYARFEDQTTISLELNTKNNATYASNNLELASTIKYGTIDGITPTENYYQFSVNGTGILRLDFKYGVKNSSNTKTAAVLVTDGKSYVQTNTAFGGDSSKVLYIYDTVYFVIDGATTITIGRGATDNASKLYVGEIKAAIYNDNITTITYMVDNANYDTQKILTGMTPNKFDRTFVGYDFSGWKTIGGDDYVPQPESTDLVLYGTKTAKTVTVSFETNTEQSADAQQIVYGNHVVLPTTLTKDHSEIEGWYTTSTFDINTKIDEATTVFPVDTVLYAKWVNVHYQVTFNTGEGGSSVDSQSIEHGSTVTKPANPTKANAVFNYWKLSGSESEYDFSTEVTGPIELEAVWKTEATVTFDSRNGSATTSEVVNYGGNVSAPSTDPIKEHFTFEGWYTSTDNGTTLSDAAFVFTTPITADITLYAKWLGEEITTTFKIDADTAYETVITNYDEIIDVSSVTGTNAPTATDKIFKGWYLSTDTNMALVDFDGMVIQTALTYYAKFVDEITITFDANSGNLPTNVESTIKIEAGSSLDSLPTPTRQDYTFAGWYDNSEFTGYAVTTSTTFDSTTTLYAKWNEIQNVNISNTFTFTTQLPTVSKNSGSNTGTCSATDSGSSDSLTLTITNGYGGSNISAYNEKYTINKSSDSTKYVSFAFSTRGSGTLSINDIITQGAAKYVTVKLYKDGVLINSEDVAGANSSPTDKNYTLSGEGDYELRFYGHSSQGSNVSFVSIVITEEYEKQI